MNNSDIDSKLVKHHKYNKSIDSKSIDSKSNDSKSNDSKSIKHTIHPCNSSGDIIWIQTPYTSIDSCDTNLNHESFLNNLLNIFNCFSMCNCPEISCPNCSCPEISCPNCNCPDCSCPDCNCHRL